MGRSLSYLPELDREAWSGVTLRHLLRHRSGLRSSHDYGTPCCETPGQLASLRPVERLAEVYLASAPGAEFAFASSNYMLLASVVERVAGLPFSDDLRERIFRP